MNRIKVKVRFTAQLKDKAGLNTDLFELNPNEKIQSLLRRLVERYGNGFGEILFDEKGFYRNSNLIAINGCQVNYEENSKLNQGDEVTILSPVSGG